MSILQNQLNVRPQLDEEQILQNIASNIKRLSKKSYDDLVEVQKRGIKLVWENKRFTPQQIIDALGADAIKIFQYHGGLTNYLDAISKIDGVEYVPALPTNAFTVDSTTGKITVTEEPYSA